MIVRKNYPGVDLRTTRARLLDENRIDPADVEVARQARRKRYFFLPSLSNCEM
jgi:hypothetical protein